MIDLRLGDCRQVLSTIPSESVDVIVTDPPYRLTSRGGSGTMSGYCTTSSSTSVTSRHSSTSCVR